MNGANYTKYKTTIYPTNDIIIATIYIDQSLVTIDPKNIHITFIHRVCTYTYINIEKSITETLLLIMSNWRRYHFSHFVVCCIFIPRQET